MMTQRASCLYLFLFITAVQATASAAQAPGPAAGKQEALKRDLNRDLDRDLLEVTIPRLQALYSSHKYTVTQVVQWYLARIARYNGIYRAVQTVDTAGALAIAAREDTEAGPHEALWASPS